MERRPFPVENWKKTEKPTQQNSRSQHNVVLDGTSPFPKYWKTDTLKQLTQSKERHKITENKRKLSHFPWTFPSSAVLLDN